MVLEDLNELSDTEKWEWILDNLPKVELMDEDEVYFIIQDKDMDEDFELHFNECLEMDEALASLFQALGFESHNY